MKSKGVILMLILILGIYSSAKAEENQLFPIDVSVNKRYDYFLLENVSDTAIGEYDAYVAQYDQYGKLISVEKYEKDNLLSGDKVKLFIDNSNYKVKSVKAFAWNRNEISTLSKATETTVNSPYQPDKNLSVFTIGDMNAVINCKEVTLNKPPVEVNNEMYISSDDFEKLGYTVENRRNTIYIKNNEMGFKIDIGECIAFELSGNGWYEPGFEILAPILNNDGIIIPVAAISELFEEKAGWHNEGKIVILNMPFYDIEYTEIYFKAILDMYYKGVVSGYDDNSFHPTQNILRSEAAVCFSRFMGHDFSEYEFECSDVSSNHWGKSWIGICINEGVFKIEDNKFRPDDYITVEEAIIATLKMQGELSHNYMEAAVANGLLTNIDEENIRRNITRAELMQLFYNVDNK